MASYPTYDLNVWLGGISQTNYSALSAGCNTTSTTTGCPLINYAIDGLYTPGSTFKLNTATAALDDGVITANHFVDDTGVYHVPQKCTSGCTYTDDEASDSGETDLAEALTKSDDYYFYNLGDLFYYSSNPDGIQKMAAEYGLGETTGIDLPGEDMGQVDSAALRANQHKENPTGSRTRATTSATTSRPPSGRARRWSPRFSRPSPMPPSPMEEPGTSPRWQLPSSARPASWSSRSSPRSPGRSACRRRPTSPCWRASRVSFPTSRVRPTCRSTSTHTSP